MRWRHLVDRQRQRRPRDRSRDSRVNKQSRKVDASSVKLDVASEPFIQHSEPARNPHLVPGPGNVTWPRMVLGVVKDRLLVTAYVIRRQLADCSIRLSVEMRLSLDPCSETSSLEWKCFVRFLQLATLCCDSWRISLMLNCLSSAHAQESNFIIS